MPSAVSLSYLLLTILLLLELKRVKPLNDRVFWLDAQHKSHSDPAFPPPE
jgi:hypothetical protein